MIHKSLIRRNWELFFASFDVAHADSGFNAQDNEFQNAEDTSYSAQDETCLRAIEALKTEMPAIFMTLVYAPSVVQSCCRARAQSYKAIGEYGRALFWECHADRDFSKDLQHIAGANLNVLRRGQGSASHSFGANISMFLDQLCISEGKLGDVLDIFDHGNLLQKREKPTSRNASKESAFSSLAGAGRGEGMLVGGRTMIRVFDLGNESIALPDVACGRLHFYVTYSYLRRVGGNNVGNRAQKFVELLTDGVCPDDLFVKVVREEIVNEGDMLPARDLLKLIKMLERFERLNAKKRSCEGVGELLERLRSMLGLAMLNSGGLDQA